MSDTAIDVVLPQTPKAGGKAKTRTIRIVAPILVALALIGIWQLYVKAGHVSHFLVPAPTDVFKNMYTARHILLREAWFTTKEMLEGFLYAVVFGVVVAILIAAIRPFELTIYPVLVGSQVIPKLAIAPVILILFGQGRTSQVIIIVSLAFFPVVISTVVGLKSVEPSKIYLARSLGASALQVLVKFRIPQSLPDMFGGIKLAATRAIGATIIAQFIIPSPGLGHLIQIYASELHPELALAAIGYVVIIGVALFFIVTKIEQLATPWHVTNRARQ